MKERRKQVQSTGREREEKERDKEINEGKR